MNRNYKTFLPFQGIHRGIINNKNTMNIQHRQFFAVFHMVTEFSTIDMVCPYLVKYLHGCLNRLYLSSNNVAIIIIIKWQWPAVLTLSMFILYVFLGNAILRFQYLSSYLHLPPHSIEINFISRKCLLNHVYS